MALLEKLSSVTKFDTENDTEMVPEFVTEIPQDPIPGEPAKPRRGRPPGPSKNTTRATPAQSATAKLRKEVSEDATTVLEMLAALWGFSGDECCAPILEQQAKPIAQALTAIAARNPRMLAALAASNVTVVLVEGLALWKALSPLVSAVYRNHVSAAVEEGEGADNDGRIHLANFPAFSGVPRTVPA